MKSFDKIWEQIHQEMDWGKYPPEEVIRFVARNYYNKDRKNIKMLEIGCGGGAVTWFLSREGFNVFALDGSETAVAKTKQRLSEENVKAEVFVSDASLISVASESYDCVIDSAVIYANKIEGIEKILEECYRVLGTGGKLFSSGLFESKMTGYGTGEELEENTYRELTEGALAHRGTVHFFSEDEIRDRWKRAGFRDLKIDHITRTDCGGEIEIRYFIVEATK